MEREKLIELVGIANAIVNDPDPTQQSRNSQRIQRIVSYCESLTGNIDDAFPSLAGNDFEIVAVCGDLLVRINDQHDDGYGFEIDRLTDLTSTSITIGNHPSPLQPNHWPDRATLHIRLRLPREKEIVLFARDFNNEYLDAFFKRSILPRLGGQPSLQFDADV